jgi:hypothetical protein
MNREWWKAPAIGASLCDLEQGEAFMELDVTSRINGEKANQSSRWRARLASYPIVLPVVLLLLMARLHDPSYVAESLWNEDALFVEQSYELGIDSLWTPLTVVGMQGYLFLYHRLVAIVASLAPLTLTPYIFFIGWILSFLMIVWVVKDRLKLMRIDSLSIVMVILAIALQPSHGEAWFNLNQAHFTTGIALCIYICLPVPRPPSLLHMLFLALTSLSGVNAAIMMPILTIQLMVLKDFRIRKSVYIIVPACAAIEAALVFASPRPGRTALNANPADWLHAWQNFLYFGSGSKAVHWLAVVFWTVTVVGIVRWIRRKELRANPALWLSPVFCICGAMLMFVVAALASGNWLASLSAMDVASRYLLIPYSLVILASFMCNSNAAKWQAAVAVPFAAICMLSFVTVDRADREASTGLLGHANMQWNAFARFHRLQPDIVIPINSPWPIYPPLWRIQLKSLADTPGEDVASAAAIQLQPQQVAPADASLTMVNGEWIVRSERGRDPALQLNVAKHCRASRYLALEIDLWRADMGLARVTWSRLDGAENVAGSLERFYPGGRSVMQFAFRRNPDEAQIWLHPAAGVADSAFVRQFASVQVSSGSLGVPGLFAKPTPPGGEARIRSIRLFCLDN